MHGDHIDQFLKELVLWVALPLGAGTRQVISDGMRILSNGGIFSAGINSSKAFYCNPLIFVSNFIFYIIFILNLYNRENFKLADQPASLLGTCTQVVVSSIIKEQK
ncbi:MAG TPA: hypothetical protein DCK95_04370 [Anaerolineaceae bacterium]|nr:hypothetical protein [Anaerolineaceae bacterium]